MPEKFTDALTYILSVSLAAAVIAFAAYKVIKLNGMEDPPANMGLNFPPAPRKILIDSSAVTTDPVITRTLGPAPDAASSGSDAAISGAVRAYELLAVVDGVAFVEIDLARGKTLVPVSVGTVLPGGMRIDSITRQGNRWVLIAGPVRLEQVEQPVQ
jgi:hypothetical protein